VTRTKALVDFNVEFAAVGKQDCEVGTLWYRSIYLKADFFYLIMKDFAEDDTGETMLTVELCLKEHGHQCCSNACYFEADDEDKKIYVKAPGKNYKTSTMTINLITKKRM
jgi:hypothetical protein